MGCWVLLIPGIIGGDWVFSIGGTLVGVGFFSEEFLVARVFFLEAFLVGWVFLGGIFGGFCGIWSVVVVARNEICSKVSS